MTRRPIWLRLVDLFMLVIAVLITAGIALNAATADHWPVRVGLTVIALWFAVMSARIGPGLVRDWRRSDTAD